MPFSLPLNFKTDANELGKYVLEFETAVDDAKKDESLRKALTVACRMLEDIDLGQLRQRVQEVFVAADRYDRDWFAKIVEDERHFSGFLNRVEAAVIDGAGIKTQTRNRILKEISSLRAAAVKRRLEVTATSVTSGIAELQRDVCLAKDQVMDVARRSAHHTKIVKMLCVIAILTDAVGQVLFPQASPGALAASIVVGGIRFIPSGP